MYFASVNKMNAVLVFMLFLLIRFFTSYEMIEECCHNANKISVLCLAVCYFVAEGTLSYKHADELCS